MQSVIIIEGGRVLDPASGRDEVADVFVHEGRFVEAPLSGAVEERVDARGRWVLPGLLDLHVHFREPGGEVSETLATGAAAAASGGFTRVVTMPNTRPAIDNAALVRWQIEESKKLAVDILPSACCSVGRDGVGLADIAAMHAAGAVAFTDDGAMVASDELMEAAMRAAAKVGAVVMDHAVVPEIAGGGVVRDCEVARANGLPVFAPEAEVEAVARDIRLARLTGCRTHIQHISCAGTIELLRAAQSEGVPVSGEVTPHHLMLAAEDIPGDDSDWKMNPPLGTRADVAALRAAVVEGVISCCATDHAPHAAETKRGGFRAGMFGVVGLETAVGASLRALVTESGMAPLDWVATWTSGPARILGIESPAITVGERADLCVVQPGDWDFERTDIVSKSKNSPFVGMRLDARAVATMRGGVWTYGVMARN